MFEQLPIVIDCALGAGITAAGSALLLEALNRWHRRRRS